MKPGKKFVQPIGIPPALHVRFSESKRTLSKDTIVESLIVYQDISRLRPINVHLGLLQQPLNSFLWVHIGPSFLDLVGGSLSATHDELPVC
jgi:hypothetical protein